jgi:hypothetical protein
MGLEAETTCRLGGKAHKVKALLESAELILRGELKRKLPIVALKNVSANGAALSFEAEGESFSLDLGAARATAWAKKIATPPPSLAMKLGIGKASQAFLIGAVEHAELKAALKGNTTANTKDASVFIAVIRSETELSAALKAYGKAQVPIWLVNIKGPKSPLGENPIREKMRAAGFKDTKTCAVSATLSGTRYNRAM